MAGSPNLHHGDCLDVMAGMEPESVDAIVTDPPYGLEFMGRAWDKLDSRARFRTRVDGRTNPKHGKSVVTVPEAYVGGSRAQEWHQRWAEAAYRVAKPSAYLLAFGGTRTVHRLASAIEDAGWIIRDMLVWGYASGFPKSKASLKPAWEPIVMARKPGPLRMLAIDACRIGVEKDVPASVSDQRSTYGAFAGRPDGTGGMDPNLGRWPANIVLTDEIFDGGIEGVVGGGETTSGALDRSRITAPNLTYGAAPAERVGTYEQDSGTYSRFFLIPKADRADREPVLGGLPSQVRGNGMQGGIRVRECRQCGSRSKNGGIGEDWPACGHKDWEWKDAPSNARANHHPTVKPTDLMRHLVRLVTPSGGTVLDPFLGSGTTAIAAEMEGFDWIGIEKEAEYVAIAEARLNGTQRGLGLDVGAPIPRMPNTHPDLSRHQPKRRAPGENWSGSWAGTDEDIA